VATIFRNVLPAVSLAVGFRDRQQGPPIVECRDHLRFGERAPVGSHPLAQPVPLPAVLDDREDVGSNVVDLLVGVEFGPVFPFRGLVAVTGGVRLVCGLDAVVGADDADALDSNN
jgi:hypothetical protein